MKNNNVNKTNKKINWKKVGVILLIILAIISVFGIVFSSLTFAKDIKYNNAKDIGDKLQITYNVALDIDKTESDDKIAKDIEKQLRDASNSFYEEVKRQNISDFEITYGVPQQNSFSQDASLVKYPDYGEINLILSVNDPGLDFDDTIAISNYKDNETSIKKDPNSSLSQQLKYFYRFANTYDLKLINLTNPDDPNFGRGYYQLNKNDNASFDKQKTLGTIKLDNSLINENGKNWNFKELQKEFVNVVNIPVETTGGDTSSSTYTKEARETTTYWEQSDYDDESAAKTFLENKTFTKQPENQYLIWNDRSDLIFRLQMSAFAAVLYNNRTSFDANSKLIFIASNLIKSLTIYEQDFGFWLASNLGNAHFLNSSSLITNNSSSDNLLNLLNEYYGYKGVSAQEVLSDEDKTTIEEYKNKNAPSNPSTRNFLYSWNLEANELIKNSLITIDYANFFKYFENNNQEWIGENEKSKFNSENYLSTNFKISSEQVPTDISPANYVELLNKASTNTVYFNSSLVSLFNYNLNFRNPNFKSSIMNIIDYLTVYSQTSLNTLITLPTYSAAFIGILAIILIIGIVVSVLYRVPGFVACLVTTLSFTLSCLIYSSLDLSFSFGSYLLLAIITILAYIPIIYILDYMRLGINKGYNLWNSFKYALRRFTKVVLGIYISLLIFGLVFLFFGFLQIQSFGVLLVISSLLGILFNGVIYALIIWALISVIEYKYNILLNKKYVEALNIIKSTMFQSATIEIPENEKSLSSKLAKTIDVRTKSKNWLLWLNVAIGLLAVAGLVLLILFGPGFSLNYTNGTLISIISEKELPQSTIDQIVSALGMKLFDKQVNISNDYTETILIFNSTNVNWTQVSKIITNLKIEGLTNFSVLENSIATSFELNSNVIKCLFIAFGFFTIWSLLWLNVFNIIPILLLQSLNVFILCGVIGLSRIPFSINSLISSLVLVIFYSTLIFALFSDLKVSYNYKKEYSKDELCNHIVKQTKWSFNKYNFAIISYLLANLILVIFVSETFWNSLFITMLSIVVLYFINYYFVPTFFTLAMLVKKFFSQERHRISISKYLQNMETGSGDRNKDFDKVDEQEIYGLNKFRVKEII